MNKRLIVSFSLLLAILVVSCNKESTYTVRLQNTTTAPIRVKVNYDQSLAAPGQNTLKLDETMQPAQVLEIYYNKGLGITLPLMPDNDSLLQYEVEVLKDDTVPCLINCRSIHRYYPNLNEKSKTYDYLLYIRDTDFPL